MTKMKHIVLASRPDGAPVADNFRLDEVDMPTPGEGEILVQVAYMSLDPYMRGRMDDAKSYASPVPIGGTMEAGAIGKVIASNHPNFAVGDYAVGRFGWADHGVAHGGACLKWDPALGSLSAGLGVLGMPGFTAWAGVTAYGKFKKGETLVVGAATGPVGSMVGQLAKQAGLRAVGIAGGADKCKMAVEKFGFDACIDHRGKDARDMHNALKAECPDGVDVYFENVGGKVLYAVLPLLNPFARMPVCGMVAWYNLPGLPEGPDMGPVIMGTILRMKVKMQGFIIFDSFPLSVYQEFAKDMTGWLKDGSVKYKEHMVEGLEKAPEAFNQLLVGGNFGKMVVKVD